MASVPDRERRCGRGRLGLRSTGNGTTKLKKRVGWQLQLRLLSTARTSAAEREARSRAHVLASLFFGQTAGRHWSANLLYHLAAPRGTKGARRMDRTAEAQGGTNAPRAASDGRPTPPAGADRAIAASSHLHRGGPAVSDGVNGQRVCSQSAHSWQGTKKKASLHGLHVRRGLDCRTSRPGLRDTSSRLPGTAK